MAQQAYQQFKLDGLRLEVGETTRDMDCPSCGKRGDISVTRTGGGLLYRCFREKCGAKGFIPSKAGQPMIKREKKAKMFNLPTTNFTHYQLKALAEKYYHMGPSREEYIKYGVVWCEEMGRVIFPCFDRYGHTWGHVARHYPFLDTMNHNKEGPKSKILRGNQNSLTVSYYRGPAYMSERNKEKIVLVEDIISAIVVSRTFDCVALLGHRIPEGLWKELTDRHVVLCLDPDVRMKAAQYVRKYSIYAKRLDSIYINKDVKDMNFKEYDDMIDEIDALTKFDLT